LLLWHRIDAILWEEVGPMEDRREVRYSLRLPPDLHAALVALARREDRSLNQQLIHLLRQGVRRAEQRRKASAAQR
jgi:hypothetical protein